MKKHRTPQKDGERYISYGVYVGPELPLRGYRAILQPHPKRWRLCLAQFDSMTIRTDGSHGSKANHGLTTSRVEEYLGFGQHEFRRKDFRSASMAVFKPPLALPVHTSIDQNGVRNIRIG